jgi:hypothetical protein
MYSIYNSICSTEVTGVCTCIHIVTTCCIHGLIIIYGHFQKKNYGLCVS